MLRWGLSPPYKEGNNMKKPIQIILEFYGNPRLQSLMRTIGARFSPGLRKKCGQTRRRNQSWVASLTPWIWTLNRGLERNVSQTLNTVKNSSRSWIWTTNQPIYVKWTLYPKGSKFLVTNKGKGRDKIQKLKPIK
jgi:hypothetical protein